MLKRPEKKPFVIDFPGPCLRSLGALRREQGMTQQQLAQVLGVTQAAVSKKERGAGLLVSSLQSAIEAMGGTLELVARFPDRVVRITDCAGADDPY